MSQGHDPVDEVTGPHGVGDHGDAGHGHDDHGHASEALGPVDWTMWAIGVLGVLVALAVVAAMVMGTGFSFTA